MNFTYQFKAWMLMSVLRLPGKKWSELLTENNRRMSATREAYQKLRDDLHREKQLEETLSQGSKSGGGSAGHFALFSDVEEPQPLYMCLGHPVSNDYSTLPKDNFSVSDLSTDI